MVSCYLPIMCPKLEINPSEEEGEKQKEIKERERRTMTLLHEEI